jgi:hypothetical protein
LGGNRASAALAVSLVSDVPAFQGLVLAFSLAEIVLVSILFLSDNPQRNCAGASSAWNLLE